MKIKTLFLLLIFISCNKKIVVEESTAIKEENKYGELIFYDDFERNETQEIKDEVGNGWTTSSDKTAKGHKEVDLKDGKMHIYIHKEANHAVSVRHKMGFKDGAIGLNFKLDHPDDVLVMNIADMTCKSVHAGHIIDVKVKAKMLEMYDLKTGIFLLEHRNAILNKTLTKEKEELLKLKSKKVPNNVSLGKWYSLIIEIVNDKLIVFIDGKEVGSFSSNGIAHDKKGLLRILVPRKVTVDNLRVWKKK